MSNQVRHAVLGASCSGLAVKRQSLIKSVISSSLSSLRILILFASLCDASQSIQELVTGIIGLLFNWATIGTSQFLSCGFFPTCLSFQVKDSRRSVA